LVLSPQKQKENTIAALADQVAALAASQPVLVIFEDAHWIDPTTQETIGAVIETIRDHRVLLVITARPEFESPWNGHAHVTPLSLNRLGRKQGVAMVNKVTSGKALPDEVLDQIVAKTDGIPLFVEELTKTVLEAGFLTEHDDRYVLDGPLPPLAIPATLQDSLMARLDRMTPVDDELEDSLQQLTNSELIFSRGMAPDATYVFKHAMVQDAAYESLLKSRRRQIHLDLAVLLESGKDAADDVTPELLGHHFYTAGLIDRAIPCLIEAGRKLPHLTDKP
jgi:predicted ATPase